MIVLNITSLRAGAILAGALLLSTTCVCRSRAGFRRTSIRAQSTNVLPSNTEESESLVVEGTQKIATSRFRDASAAFTWELFNLLAKRDSGNIVFSPYSVYSVLGMLRHGAEGETKRQIVDVMRFENAMDSLSSLFIGMRMHKQNMDRISDRAIKIANAVWIQKQLPVSPTFADDLLSIYAARVHEIDFLSSLAATTRINEWVRGETEGMVDTIISLDVIDKTVRMILINTMFFSGEWICQFDKTRTIRATFRISNTDSVLVPTMHRDGDCSHASNENLHMIALPYRGGFTMYVVKGVRSHEVLYDNDNLMDEISELEKKCSQRSISLAIPRFRITGDYRTDSVLQVMGIRDAFTPLADFSGISKAEKLYVSAIIQKAYVETHERGTEAGAVTAAFMKEIGEWQRPLKFTIDRPFLFYIREDVTGTILFIGRVMDPTKTGE